MAGKKGLLPSAILVCVQFLCLILQCITENDLFAIGSIGLVIPVLVINECS